MTVGNHVVTVTPLGGSAVDISCLVDTVTIHHGRPDSDSQPDASSCTLDISLDTGEDVYPPEMEVGATVRVTSGTGASIRFVGKITDITQAWADEFDNTPEAMTAQVIAMGPLSDLGRRIVGDVPFPQELDGARVSRIMTAAGINLSPATSDPGTVQILTRDVDSQPALDLVQSVADTAGGLVWTTRGGEIRYADADHRRGTVSALTLDACDILVTPTWRRTTEGLINKVSIGYGVTPEGSDQPRFVAQRDDSISVYGRYEFTTTTELAALADASAMGNLLLTRNREPVWIMSDLPVYVPDLSAAETTALLGLEVGSLIVLTGLPASGTAPTSANLWVEGWTETLTYGTHDISLVVSGFCRTVPPPRWNDVPPDRTWDSMGTTWINRMVNPDLETNTQYWGSSNSANWPLTRDTAAPIYGAASAMTTRTASNPSATVNTVQVFAPEVIGGTNNNRFAAAPGDLVSVRMRIKIEGIPRNINGYISWRNDTGGQISTSTPLVLPANAVGAYTFTFTGTAPDGTVAYIPTFYVTVQPGQGNAPTNERVWHDALLVQTNGDPALAYWDGDTPDTVDFGYSWAGDPHASASLRQTGPSWDDATCLGPLPNLGRWDDIAATQRWDGLPSSVTWNTWPTN